jgi:hypothetical protein
MPVSLAATAASELSTALVPIRTITLDGNAATASFTNIPQTYKHLVISSYARSNFQASGTQTTFSIYLNNAIFGLTSFTTFAGNGVGIFPARATSGAFGLSTTIPAGTTDLGFFGSGLHYIFDYTSNRNKTVISKSNFEVNSNGNVQYVVMLYRDTSAITTVNLSTNGVYQPGSVFTLYGLVGA